MFAKLYIYSDFNTWQIFIHMILPSISLMISPSVSFVSGCPNYFAVICGSITFMRSQIFIYFSLYFWYDTNHYAAIQSSNIPNKVCRSYMYKISVKMIGLWGCFLPYFRIQSENEMGSYYCSLLDIWLDYIL